MGYNITKIEIRNADGFGVFPADLPALVMTGDQPEAPFSWKAPPSEPDTTDRPWATDEAGFARLIGNGAILTFPWSGDWSGQVFDVLRDRVLPAFKGYAELFITWEDGDSHSGLRCDNGKVTEHGVVLSLAGSGERSATTKSEAVDALLNAVSRWEIIRTPDGVVMVIKGDRAESLADWVRNSLMLGEGAAE